MFQYHTCIRLQNVGGCHTVTSGRCRTNEIGRSGRVRKQQQSPIAVHRSNYYVHVPRYLPTLGTLLLLLSTEYLLKSTVQYSTGNPIPSASCFLPCYCYFCPPTPAVPLLLSLENPAGFICGHLERSEETS